MWWIIVFALLLILPLWTTSYVVVYSWEKLIQNSTSDPENDRLSLPTSTPLPFNTMQSTDTAGDVKYRIQSTKDSETHADAPAFGRRDSHSGSKQINAMSSHDSNSPQVERSAFRVGKTSTASKQQTGNAAKLQPKDSLWTSGLKKSAAVRLMTKGREEAGKGEANASNNFSKIGRQGSDTISAKTTKSPRILSRNQMPWRNTIQNHFLGDRSHGLVEDLPTGTTDNTQKLTLSEESGESRHSLSDSSSMWNADDEQQIAKGSMEQDLNLKGSLPESRDGLNIPDGLGSELDAGDTTNPFSFGDEGPPHVPLIESGFGLEIHADNLMSFRDVVCLPSLLSLTDDLFRFASALGLAAERGHGLMLPADSLLREVFELQNRFRGPAHGCPHQQTPFKPAKFPTDLRERVRRHLPFSEDLKASALSVLEDLMENHPMEKSPATIVGIHLDMSKEEALGQSSEKSDEPWKFLKRAMAHFDSKYPNALYVVLVEDPRTKNITMMNLRKEGIKLTEYLMNKSSTPIAESYREAALLSALGTDDRVNGETEDHPGKVNNGQNSSSIDKASTRLITGSQPKTSYRSFEEDWKQFVDYDPILDRLSSVKKRDTRKKQMKHNAAHPADTQPTTHDDSDDVIKKASTETSYQERQTESVPTVAVGTAAKTQGGNFDEQTEKIGKTYIPMTGIQADMSAEKKAGFLATASHKHTAPQQRMYSTQKPAENNGFDPELQKIFRVVETLNGLHREKLHTLGAPRVKARLQPRQRGESFSFGNHNPLHSRRPTQDNERTEIGKLSRTTTGKPSQSDVSKLWENEMTASVIGKNSQAGHQKVQSDDNGADSSLAGAVRAAGTQQGGKADLGDTLQAWLEMRGAKQEKVQTKAHSESPKPLSLLLEELIQMMSSSRKTPAKSAMARESDLDNVYESRSADDISLTKSRQPRVNDSAENKKPHESFASYWGKILHRPAGERDKDLMSESAILKEVSSKDTRKLPSGRRNDLKTRQKPLGDWFPTSLLEDVDMKERETNDHDLYDLEDEVKDHDPYVLGGRVVHVLEPLPPALALAILAHSNHTILTSPLGWWGALLGGGEAVYPRSLAAPPFLQNSWRGVLPLPVFPEWRGV